MSLGAASGGRSQGIASMSMLECEGDSKMRMGIWFGPDPDPDAPIEDLDLTGTAADPAAIEEFYAHFDLCK